MARPIAPESGAQPGQTGDHDRKWWGFAALALSVFTMVMSMSMVYVALSAIADDFEVTLRNVSWVVITEALVISAFMLPAGRLADLVGRKRLHLTGLVVFGIGAVLVASAPTFGFLIAARAVMATGSSMGQSVGTAMVVSLFPPEERGKAIGSHTTSVSIGAASGPVVAGVLLQFVSWEWLFYLLVIPVSIAFVAGVFLLDEAKVSAGARSRDTPFDWFGAILSGLAITATVLTINDPFGVGWGSPIIAGGAVLSAALLIVFVKVELAREHPMLDLRLFANRAFGFAVAARLFGFMASTTSRFLMPIFLISLRGMAEGAAGGVLFLISIGMGIAAQSSGRLSDRLGTVPIVAGGLVLLATTGVAMGLMTERTNLAVVMVVVFLFGFANGAWHVPNTSAMLGAAPASSLGVVGALSNLTRNLGNVFGQAIAATAVVGIMVSQGFDIPLSEISDTPGAGAAFIDGWRLAHFLLAGYAIVALVLNLASAGSRRHAGTPEQRRSTSMTA